MSVQPLKRAALLVALLAAACAPAGEPIIAPLPSGAALDTAGRPFVREVVPPPEFQAAVAKGTRTLTGAPGPEYWQQRVHYTIRAELDPEAKSLEGWERVVLRNATPQTLETVTLNLYQNLFSQELARGPLNTGGLDLRRVVVGNDTLRRISQAEFEAGLRERRHVPGFIVSGTLGRVVLPSPLLPGDSAVFVMEWKYKIPPVGAPRTAVEDTLGGRVFQVAQWYPQIAVFDDIVGQDITPYRGQGEFYLEYGDFDVALTLPAGWIVGATGVLENPTEVLTPETLAQLAIAATSDTVVRVATLEDLRENDVTLGGANGRLTWRFTAENVRDFGFSTSNRYLWDASRAVVPEWEGTGVKDVLVYAMYRPGAPHWPLAVRYAEHSLEYLSRVLVPYPYPQVTVAEGPIYGMEYPMLMFVGRPNVDRRLYEVIAHEMAHEWFPMLVGQDEAAYAWMDEGFATYLEAIAFNDFWEGATHFEEPRQAYLAIAGTPAEQPLMSNADLIFGPAFAVAAYYKPGTLLRSLREVVGDSVFYQAVNTYAREWAYKHPTPWDFFNTVERVYGKDLDWFWYPFWYRTVTLDQGISTVERTPEGVRVTVRDFGQAPAPTPVVVFNQAGERFEGRIPIEDWLSPNTRVATVTIPVTGEVARVVLDPEQYFPDVRRENNVWRP